VFSGIPSSHWAFCPGMPRDLLAASAAESLRHHPRTSKYSERFTSARDKARFPGFSLIDHAAQAWLISV